MSDMEKPRETFRRLHALANNAAASDSERETARTVMARYLAKYGSEVGIPDEEPVIHRDVTYTSEFESRLATHCGMFAGCATHDVGKYLRAGTTRETFKADGKTTRYKGPESAVLAAVALYAHHRTMLFRLLELTENGYRHGAMRLPSAKVRAQAEPMSPEMSAALRAAQKAGNANAMTKRIGDGG
jgi:hypothetical protein